MKKTFLVLITIILLALIGGGVFAYTVVFEAPRSALTESFTTITNARSLHQDVAIKVVADSPMAFTAEGTVATDIEQSATGGRRVAMTITGKSAGFFVSAEARFLDQTLYGKVIEFPLLSLLDFSTSTNPLGKWYSVSLSEVESFMTEQGADPADIAKIKDQISKIGQTEGVSQFDALIEKEILVFGPRATVVKVGDAWARQYTVTIDKDKLASWATEKGSDLPSLPISMGIAPIDPQALTESLKSITFDPIIITIGLLDHSLKKIAGGFKIPEGSISIAVTYRDINGSITVAKPDNAIPLMQYIGQSMTEAKSKATKAEIKDELSSLRAEAEVYYDVDGGYTNLCVKDSAITAILKSVEEKSGQKPTCRANNQAFLVVGEIASSTLWCVDSTGFSGGVDKIPTGFVCK